MAKLIDAHVHVGSSIYGEKLELKELLNLMDYHMVERSIVASFTPPDLDFSKANHEVALSVKSYPDRLIGAVRVDPRSQDSCKNEIYRMAETYGFLGVAFAPTEQGFPVNHPLIIPAIELAQELGLFVHVPTGYPLFSAPTQVATLARQFPSVPFLLGHMGLGSYFYDALKVVKYYSNIYLETSGHVVTGQKKNGIKMAVEAGGIERVIFASDSPYFDIGIEKLKISRANLAPESESLILYGNILKLLSQIAK